MSRTVQTAAAESETRHLIASRTEVIELHRLVADFNVSIERASHPVRQPLRDLEYALLKLSEEAPDDG